MRILRGGKLGGLVLLATLVVLPQLLAQEIAYSPERDYFPQDGYSMAPQGYSTAPQGYSVPFDSVSTGYEGAPCDQCTSADEYGDEECGCAACRHYLLPFGLQGETSRLYANGGPYGDGTCGPHWFDVQFEFMYLQREDISRRLDFTRTATDSFPPATHIVGPVVLSTDNLNFHEEPGFRVTGTYQVGAASHLEGSYFGTFHWSSAAEVTSATNNLYSVLSDFGNLPFGGFLQTDQAALQRIEYASELNSVELNWRHHWVGPSYLFHGSWLIGVRYVRLEEDFRYLTDVVAHDDPLTGVVDPNERGPANMDYLLTATNDLVGLQLGGDIFACLLPGLTVGGELKAGVYGNRAEQETIITATNLVTPTRESAADDDVAFVAEAGGMVIYQVSPWLSLRGGYQLLFMDGVALGPENFNTAAPFPGPRPAFVNHNGDAFYHGFTAGIEYLW